MTEMTDSLDNTTYWDYDAVGNLTDEVDADGSLWSYRYDARDRLISEITALGHETTYAYDTAGNLSEVKDPMGHATHYSYDALDRLTTVTDAQGGQTGYAYNAVGNMSARTDARGMTTEMEYDLAGRLVQETSPLGGRSQYAYDSVGRVSTMKDPNGMDIAYSYTPSGQVSSIDFGGVEAHQFAYDLLGRVTTAENAAATLQYEYDAMGRITRQTNVGSEKTTTFAYDAVGNTTGITDPEARTIRYTYDTEGNTTALIDPDGNKTAFEYDPMGRETARRNPNGTSIEREYTPDGRLAYLANKNHGRTASSYAYDYDANGNKTYQVEEDGAETAYVYDAMDRLTEVYYPVDKINGIREENLTMPERYAPLKDESALEPGTESNQDTSPGNSNQKGPSDGKGNNGKNKETGTLTPDEGRLLVYLGNLLIPLGAGNGKGGGNGGGGNGNGGGGNGNGHGKGNNGNGSKNKNLTPEERKAEAKEQGKANREKYANERTKERDKEKVNGKGLGKQKMNPGRLKKLALPWLWSEQMLGTPDIELGYMTYLERPDYLMDPSELVEYEYDENGNRTKMTTDQGSVEYTYDENDRMVSDGTRTFNYDANGNMVRVTAEEQSIAYSYTPSNKLERIDYPDTTYVQYGYDPFGRKTTREEGYWKLSQGSGNDSAPGRQNKPDKINQNNGKAIGKEDAYGQLKKGNTTPLKMDTAAQQYVYDRFSINVMNEYTDHGSPVGEYYLANDTVVARKMFGLKGALVPGREEKLDTNGGLMYFQYDGLMNVTALADRHGDTIEEYRYDAFGNLFTGITAPYNTSSFVGKHYDPKAGMIDNHARWYAPDFGRFVTADTYRGELQTPYTQNRYAYVGNNPVNRWDPLGYWQAGDENYSSSTQDKIREATNNYNSSTTQAGKDAAHAAAEYARSSERTSIDPSGTYHPDGSFTPKDDGSSGSGSNHHSGGGGSSEPTAYEMYGQNQEYIGSKAGALPQTSMGTVSKKTMDSYYVSFNGITDAKYRNSWASEAQSILKEIDRVVSLERYGPKTDTIIRNQMTGLYTIHDNLVPLGNPNSYDMKELQMMYSQIYYHPKQWENTGDKQVDTALNRFEMTQPQFQYGDDPMYGQAKITFHTLLLRMDSQGIDVSKLSINNLNSMFEHEMEYQRDFTLFLAGVGEVKIMSGGKVVVKEISDVVIESGSKSGEPLFKMDLQLFSKKDIKQIEDVAKQFKMSPQQRREFGDYVESLKDLVPNNKNFSYKQLQEIAKEYLGVD